MRLLCLMMMLCLCGAFAVEPADGPSVTVSLSGLPPTIPQGAHLNYSLRMDIVLADSGTVDWFLDTEQLYGYMQDTLLLTSSGGEDVRFAPIRQSGMWEPFESGRVTVEFEFDRMFFSAPGLTLEERNGLSVPGRFSVQFRGDVILTTDPADESRSVRVPLKSEVRHFEILASSTDRLRAAVAVLTRDDDVESGAAWEHNGGGDPLLALVGSSLQWRLPVLQHVLDEAGEDHGQRLSLSYIRFAWRCLHCGDPNLAFAPAWEQLHLSTPSQRLASLALVALAECDPRRAVRHALDSVRAGYVDRNYWDHEDGIDILRLHGGEEALEALVALRQRELQRGVPSLEEYPLRLCKAKMTEGLYEGETTLTAMLNVDRIDRAIRWISHRLGRKYPLGVPERCWSTTFSDFDPSWEKYPVWYEEERRSQQESP